MTAPSPMDTQTPGAATGEGAAPGHPTCRITGLVSNGGARYCLPFVLTAACGWTTDVEQGVPYETNTGIARWAAHQCLTAASTV